MEPQITIGPPFGRGYDRILKRNRTTRCGLKGQMSSPPVVQVISCVEVIVIREQVDQKQPSQDAQQHAFRDDLQVACGRAVGLPAHPLDVR